MLDIFWKVHDPTSLNKQGYDEGKQYRSAIFFRSEEQRKKAELSKNTLQASGLYNASIVTEITPFTKFFAAESYHYDFYERNPNLGYCRIIISPKVLKIKEEYRDILKSDYITD
ncbi:MAG: peptide-methionine (S)-S-oxide reductase [Candidatus Dojkabacteria bacterium]|nr:peptide-methionine (S)-S-oxide reductase [Candidatus Dojkabacteria bacterium]